MKGNDIFSLLEKRILVLDGAMGTMIQSYRFGEEDYRGERFWDWPSPLKGNNDLLSLTQPQVIREIHEAYLEVGADILETNTFSSTTIAMRDYKMESLVYEINFAAAQLAKKAAQKYTEKTPHKPRFVAGSIGPTNQTASISPDINNPGYRAIDFDTLKRAFKEQAISLIEGGVDILLVETIIDTLNAKAALFGIEEAFEEKRTQIPLMVSGTITDASGRTLSGQTTEAFLISLSHAPMMSIGLNCALGADLLKPYVKRLADNASCLVSVHPNAGLPNAFGEYDQSPEEMAEMLKSFLEEGLVNIIGGCCGTTPQHILKISELASKYPPRKLR